MLRETIEHRLLPDGAIGIDAGLTLTKTVRAVGASIEAHAHETSAGDGLSITRGGPVGVTGARAQDVLAKETVVRSQEIDAAARGVAALLAATGRAPDGPFVMALLGTGTAFAAVRTEGGAVTAQHLGGAALGGGSFAALARFIAPALSYGDVIAAAARGDRRKADTMVSDAYPEGIGRIGGDLTAAHLGKAHGASADDVLAALLNLHGESIAQIAASRAVIAQIRHVVLAGGFAHDNAPLVAAITAMASMFGVRVDVSPSPGFAGAIGAALIASEAPPLRSDGEGAGG
jgi:type II pantothenate kinase